MNMDQSRSELNKEKIREIIDQWKSEVKSVKPEEVAYYVILYKGNKEDDAIAYKASINNDIGKEFVNTLTEDISSLDSDNVIEYDKTDSLSERFLEICYTSDIPNFSKLLNAAHKSDNLIDINEINNDKGLKLVVRIGEFYGFGQIVRHKIMSNKHRVFLSLNKKGEFKTIKDDIYFEVPTTFSAISFGNHIIIKNEKEFEKVFKYHEKIIQIILGKHKENEKLFNNPELFEESIKKDSRKARKLYLLYKNNYVENINLNDFMGYAKRFISDVILDDETGKISVTGNNIWHVVSLLCEDYFNGPLTKRKFCAEYKNDIS